MSQASQPLESTVNISTTEVLSGHGGVALCNGDVFLGTASVRGVEIA